MSTNKTGAATSIFKNRTGGRGAKAYAVGEHAYTVGKGGNFANLQDAFNFMATYLTPLTPVTVAGTFNTTQYSDTISITGGNLATQQIDSSYLFRIDNDENGGVNGSIHYYTINKIISEEILILDTGVVGPAQVGLTPQLFKPTKVSLILSDNDYMTGEYTINSGYQIPDGFDISIIGTGNTHFYGDPLRQQFYGLLKMKGIKAHSGILCGGNTNIFPFLGGSFIRLDVESCLHEGQVVSGSSTNQRQPFNGVSCLAFYGRDLHFKLVDHGGLPATDGLYVDGLYSENPSSWESVIINSKSNANPGTKHKYLNNLNCIRYRDQSAALSFPACLRLSYGTMSATKSPIVVNISNSNFYDNGINHASFPVVDNGSNVVNSGLAHTYNFANCNVDFTGTHGSDFVINGTLITVNQRNTKKRNGAALVNTGTATYSVS